MTGWQWFERKLLPWVAMVGIVLGAGFLYLAGNDLIAYYTNRPWTWPTTQGKVVHMEIFNAGGRHGGDDGWAKYRYTVNGQTYTSQTDRMGAWQVKRWYPEGKAVTVHYHPAHPGQSTPYAGISWADHGTAVGALLCLSGAVYFYGRMIGRKLQGKEAKWPNIDSN
jgi:hypothetical protein